VNTRHKPGRANLQNPSCPDFCTTFPLLFAFSSISRPLTPLFPLDTSHSPVSPFFPLLTQKQGGRRCYLPGNVSRKCRRADIFVSGENHGNSARKRKDSGEIPRCADSARNDGREEGKRKLRTGLKTGHYIRKKRARYIVPLHGIHPETHSRNPIRDAHNAPHKTRMGHPGGKSYQISVIRKQERSEDPSN
jgi:hypothetical protein